MIDTMFQPASTLLQTYMCCAQEFFYEVVKSIFLEENSDSKIIANCIVLYNDMYFLSTISKIYRFMMALPTIVSIGDLSRLSCIDHEHFSFA